jgi:hypothetical protein
MTVVMEQGAAYASTYLTREPYLSVLEYEAEPTGLRLSDLIPANPNNPNPTQADQDLAVKLAIEGASSWIDELLKQPLAATVQTESLRARADYRGVLRVHPTQWPLLECVSAMVGPNPQLLQPVSQFANVLVEEQMVSFYPGSVGMFPMASPIQFGSGLGAPGSEMIIFLTYIAGWPNAFLTAPASAGDTSIEVSTTTGICPPLPSSIGGNAVSQMNLYDGASKEAIVATAQDPVGLTVTLQTGLLANHPEGSRITGLPPAIRKAVVLATTGILKTRGGGGYVMNSTKGQPQKAPPKEAISDRDRDMIAQLLVGYRAVIA